MTWTTYFQQRLQEKKSKNLWRERRVVSQRQGVQVVCEGKSYVNFSSNDYLCLANHPAVIAAGQEGLQKYGVASGGSQLLFGHYDAHRQLEEAFAKFLHRDRAVYFNNGYMANIGIASALMGKQDQVFADKFCHASILDALQLMSVRIRRYAHNDTDHLASRLQHYAHLTPRHFMVSDGVFSMEGDHAPLPQLVKLSQQYASLLIVDDTHGVGVFGPQGGGTVEHFGMTQCEVPLLMCSLAKSFACTGAIIAGDADLIENIIQFARPYMFSSAQPPALACCALASLQVLQEEAWRRDVLTQRIIYFKQQAKQYGFHLLPSSTAIQSIVLGEALHARGVAKALFDRGFWVGLIRPPAVPRNTARLRIILTCEHSEGQIDGLLDKLSEVLSGTA